MDTIEENLPPHSIEAEEAVLGSLVIDPDEETYYSVRRVLQPDDFYRIGHRRVYEAIGRLHEERIPVDVVTLIDTLRSAGHLEAAGGETSLINLLNAVPTSIHVDYYAEIVAEKARRRRLITRAGRMARIAYAEDSDLGVVKDVLFEAAGDLDGRDAGSGVATGVELAGEYIDMLHDAEGGVFNMTVPLHFGPLEPFFEGGVWRGQLMSIFARPSVGKTVVGMNLALRQALAGVGVAVVSLEMKRYELVHRMVRSLVGIPFSMVRYAAGDVSLSAAQQASLADCWLARITGKAPETLQEAVLRASGLISDLPITIIDYSRMSVRDIAAELYRADLRQRVDVAYIDHVLLIQEAAGGFEKDAGSVTAMFTGLKVLAGDLDILVVALQQSNRESEKRDEPVLRLTDMYQGGEQSSNIVIGLEVPLGPDRRPAMPFGAMNLRVLKNRDGTIGVVSVPYDYRSFSIGTESIGAGRPANGAGRQGELMLI